jgi:hypothetical protein
MVFHSFSPDPRIFQDSVERHWKEFGSGPLILDAQPIRRQLTWGTFHARQAVDGKWTPDSATKGKQTTQLLIERGSDAVGHAFDADSCSDKFYKESQGRKHYVIRFTKMGPDNESRLANEITQFTAREFLCRGYRYIL